VKSLNLIVLGIAIDRKQILVVDDDPDTLELLSELLRINGWALSVPLNVRY
jgi:CheY-like chemotaxis protein